MKVSATLATISLFACAACGGGDGMNGGGAAGGASGPSAVGANYDAATGLFNFTANGVAQPLLPQPGHNTGAFAHYHAEAPEARGYAVRTPNSGLVILASEGAAVGYGGTSFENLTSTSLPQNGRVTYRGTYAGFLRNETVPNSDISSLITGDATLAANYTDNAIDGTISNRQSRSPATNRVVTERPLSDLILEAGTIDGAGAFSGMTSGGEIDVENWAPASGTYSGVITGPNGQELVGGVTVVHRSPFSVPFSEIGGFIAED